LSVYTLLLTKQAMSIPGTQEMDHFIYYVQFLSRLWGTSWIAKGR
jgi:hypothetical protein